MSFSSASQEEMFPGALQKKIYPINTHYITCIIMGLLIEGPPFFKDFSHHFPYEKKMFTCQQQVWPPAHHLVHCWDSPCGTRQPQYQQLPASQNRLFFWGEVFACQSKHPHQQIYFKVQLLFLFVKKKIYIYIFAQELPRSQTSPIQLRF